MNTQAERYERAMYRFFRHIQDHIENMPGWHQADGYSVDIDAYEFNRFVSTLAKPSNAPRWHELHQSYGEALDSVDTKGERVS